MPLNTRLLKVTIDFRDGLPGAQGTAGVAAGQVVVIDQSLDMRVKISKAALAVQNHATIDVMGLSTSLRQQLLSQFTAWNKRQSEQSTASNPWVGVTIEAGYNDTPTSSAPVGTSSQSSNVVYKGEIVLCEPTSGPPNIGIRITCFTRQKDKTNFVAFRTGQGAPPTTATLRQLAQWVAQAMGGLNLTLNSQYAETVITNFACSAYSVGALLIALQNCGPGSIVAFVDDDNLIVKDITAVINPGSISNLTTFIDTPMWTEWGVYWRTLMDPTQKLAQAVNLTSSMNPGVNGSYVIDQLEYDLTSRGEAFYVRGYGSPPA